MFYDLLIFIFMSYIKPQLSAEPSALLVVVYRTIPTSNHNLWLAIHFTLMLYIILFLHQTTTCQLCLGFVQLLYIILFLHQTTTSFPQWFVGTKLYIVLFLHQTTTLLSLYPHPAQLYIVLFLHQTTTPWGLAQSLVRLYIVLFLHQTTTPNEHYRINPRLYIVLFLHQTTTIRRNCRVNNCCISYYSYIKPQPSGKKIAINAVVYRTIPTSNHNCGQSPPPCLFVVYRTIPTSNHNRQACSKLSARLYIVLFLHQTTTT